MATVKFLIKMEGEMKKIYEELFAPISCLAKTRVTKGRTSESQ